MNNGSVYVPGKVRTTQSPYYDSYSVATTTAVVPTGKQVLFGSVSGVGSVTAAQTNMSKAFELSGGESFLLKAFRVVFLGCAAADIVSFCTAFTVRLIIGSGSTAYCDAPAEYWAGGAGVNSGNNNGIADPRAIVPFDVDPIRLESGINFRVEYIGTTFTSTAAFFTRVYLDGQKTQPAG